MSDRVTNIEIEDVLSSIRRLVMEGGGAAASSAADVRAAPAARPVDASDDLPANKFVLTPALRVADPGALRPVPPTPAPVHAAPVHAAQPAAPGPFAVPSGARPTVTISPPAPIHTPWPDNEPLSLNISPDASLPGDDLLRPGTGDLLRPGTGDLPESDFADAAEDADGTVVDASFIDRRLRLSDMAAGLEAAVTAQPDDWEPDGSENVPVMDWTQTASEDTPVFRSRHAAPLRLDQPVEPVAARGNPPLSFVVREATGPVQASASADDESDDPDGIAQFEAVAADAITDDLAAFLGNGGAIDEQMLRNLVVEIVRQELQGTLGERITRNVRKLVRREIAQALANPDFE